MQTMTRRQWLIRAGGAAIVPSLLSSCRPAVSRHVEPVGARLADAYDPLTRNDCVACDNCMPCPYGIDIPTNLIFIDKAISDGYMPGKLDEPDFADKGARFLTRYEAAMPDAAQSQHCISCGECLGTCPVDIRIPEQLQKLTGLTDVLRDLRCRQML